MDIGFSSFFTPAALDGPASQAKTLQDVNNPHSFESQIYRLPNELLYRIFSYLKPIDLTKIQQCSQHFKCLADEELLWKGLLEKWFSASPLKTLKQEEGMWKREFVRLYSEKAAFAKFLVAARAED